MNAEQSVWVVNREYPNGYTVGPHTHSQGQLTYAIAGVMELSVGEHVWLIPPARGLWIPSEMEHRMRARGAVSLRSVYVESCAGLAASPLAPQAVLISPLLRELIVRANGLPKRYAKDSKEARIMSLLMEEITWSDETALRLPTTRDPRLRRICSAILDNPADPRGLAEWAGIVGASQRTLARLFHARLGVSYLYWRQQAAVMAALPRLCAGEAVTLIAGDLGYETPGAFSAMFRRIMRTSPSQYRNSVAGAQTG
ncbi:AraC-like DNA-binding protein [Janthinobacterium sp. CG_23.3]|uniref:AraC family transcriptional regulator n=1 Tax=Janthinobacterium sp. CG_23.3 TaxID=3349634 RepID=UPI0038D49BC5